jgi:hypothetical protein
VRRITSKFTTRNVYAAGIVIAIALGILRYHGMSVLDFARLARAKVAEAAQDLRERTSRDYADRYSRKLREEAAAIPTRIQDVDGKESIDITGDIQAERKRILQERADHLEKVGAGLLKGDLGSLQKQVEENARRAAGDH